MEVNQQETKSIFNKLTDKVSTIFETFNEMMRKGVKIKDIVEMVKNHENTLKTSKTLLGITFDFYKLQLNELNFRLETKPGAIEKILYFRVYTSDHNVLTYRSYEDGITLEDQVKTDHLPEIVKGNR